MADQSKTTIDPSELERVARKWMLAENKAAEERRESGLHGTSQIVSQTQCDAVAAKRELRQLLGGKADP